MVYTRSNKSNSEAILYIKNVLHICKFVVLEEEEEKRWLKQTRFLPAQRSFHHLLGNLISLLVENNYKIQLSWFLHANYRLETFTMWGIIWLGFNLIFSIEMYMLTGIVDICLWCYCHQLYHAHFVLIYIYMSNATNWVYQ